MRNVHSPFFAELAGLFNNNNPNKLFFLISKLQQTLKMVAFGENTRHRELYDTHSGSITS